MIVLDLNTFLKLGKSHTESFMCIRHIANPDSLLQAAIPKNMAIDRFTASINVSSALPKVVPILSRLSVTALSTMIWERFPSPLVALGSTMMRNSGAFTNSLVTGKTPLDASVQENVEFVVVDCASERGLDVIIRVPGEFIGPNAGDVQ